jgi:DedD protein
MEHFEAKQNIREKSLYTLHLDTPRVVIAVSLFLGIIALVFLLGMTFTKEDKVQADNITASELLASGGGNLREGIDSQAGQDLMPLPESSPPAEGETIRPADSEIFAAGTSGMGTGASGVPGAGTPASGTPASGTSTSGVLPANDFQPANNNAISAPKKTAQAKKETRKKPERTAAVPHKKEKSSVVGVVNSAPAKSVSKSGFAVQVASYDKRSKAVNEIENLKKLHYSAYVDGASVDGKQFFRVRIGPVSSREKASSILEEIQDNGRYDACYIVKE